MKISPIKADDKTTAQYTVSIPVKDVSDAIDAKLQEYSKDATIQGFRKGKAPMRILHKRYGDSALSEYVNSTVQETVESIAKDNDLKVAMQPSVNVTSAGVGEALEFEISYVLSPEITLMDVSKLKLSTIKAKVDAKQVDEYLEQMAKQSRESEPVERKAKSGDVVVIDFAGSVDGVAFDGGTANDHSLELGSGSFIPGFEDQLVGTKAGDSKDVNVTFPEEYQAKDLAGKDAVFACTVKEVKQFKDAKIDDELAKKFGLEDLKALKDAVKTQFSNQFAADTRPLVKKDIMDAFDKNHQFDLPQVMVDQEFNDIWEQITKAKEAGQLDSEDASKTDKQLKDDYMALANRRVRLGFVLSHVAAEWNIEVSQDDVNNAIMQEAQRYQGQETQVFEYYQKNPEIVNQLRAPILEEKVVDAILEKADITEKEMTPEEIQALLVADEDSAKPAKKAKAKKSTAKKSTAKKAKAKKSTAKKAKAQKS